MSNLCPETDRPNGRHNWRHLTTRDDGALVGRRYLDTWYCTQCRTIQTTERPETTERP